MKQKIEKCIDCGKETELSPKGLCSSCGFERMEEARRQIKNKEGPIYETWKARLKASVE